MDEGKEEFAKAVDELAQLFTADAEEHYMNHLQSFDVYAQKVRSEFRQTLFDFEKHFTHGYEVLLQEIKEQQAFEEAQKPGAGPWMKA